jgi:hypothetical protein
MMFDGTCDSITVPSCEKHNTTKGPSDQAIIHGFLLTLKQGIDRYHYSNDVLNAINDKQSSFERTKHKAFNIPILFDKNELPYAGYIESDIKGWMRQLTAALVWDGVRYFDKQIDWKKADAWSPHFIEALNPIPFEVVKFKPILFKKLSTESELEKLNWENGWSAFPRPYPEKLFSFQICFLSDRRIILKYLFYNSYKWYVMFKATKKAKARLATKIHTLKSPSNSSS